MQNPKKQGGFVAMVGLLIALSFLSYAFILYTEQAQKQRIKEDAHSFYNRLLFLTHQIHAYNADQYQAGTPINSSWLFPKTLSDLEGAYVPTCLPADNAQGYCMLIEQSPWGKVEYERQAFITPTGVDTYRAVMSFTLPDPSDPAFSSEHSMTLSMLTQLPNLTYDESSNLITLYVTRPDMAFAYDGLVKRSGDDSTLLGDWDVGGNFALVNAKDYTIRNSDGSQQLVSRGLTEVLSLEHGDFITKPACPSGTTPDITLGIGAIKISNTYDLTGSQKPYLLAENSTQWQVGLEIRAIEKSTGNPKKLNTGVISAFVQCK